MAIKNGLNNNAYTGDASQGNPYVGDLRKGIDYDLYEANFPVVDGTKPQAKFSCGYRSLARNLVNYAGDELSHNGIYFNGKVLDAGSGTGISSLEIVSHFPFASVKGV